MCVFQSVCLSHYVCISLCVCVDRSVWLSVPECAFSYLTVGVVNIWRKRYMGEERSHLG